MNFEFPKMMFRFPATGVASALLEGATYDTCDVADADAEAARAAEGWHTTWPAARQADADAKAAAAAVARQAAENTPPTREELEQKARELGIAFDGRTSDKKLSDLIKATLET